MSVEHLGCYALPQIVMGCRPSWNRLVKIDSYHLYVFKRILTFFVSIFSSSYDINYDHHSSDNYHSIVYVCYKHKWRHKRRFQTFLFYSVVYLLSV